MENIDKYWDNIHKKYTSTYDGWLNKYVDLLKKDDVIVELGCGRAYSSKFLKEKGFKNITACDFSKEALDAVNSECQGLKLMNFDMSKGLPFDDNSIDIIIADLCLHYFNNKTTQYIVNEIYRVIKNGGYIIGRVNALKESEKLNVCSKKIEENFYYEEPIYKRFFSKNSLEKYFSKFDKYNIEEKNMDRYEKPKVLIEFCMMKNK